MKGVRHGSIVPPKIIINSVTLSETRDEIDEQLSTLRREGLVGKDNPISVVVDGKTLTFALDPSLKKDFLDLCCRHGFAGHSSRDLKSTFCSSNISGQNTGLTLVKLTVI